MKTRTLLIALVPLIIIAAVLLRLSSRPDSASSQPIDPQVALTVAQFGKQLQKVPLLGSPETTRVTMESSYGPYVTTELLSVWEANPQNAPGRLTSSPWPDRIEILSVDPQADDSYVVHGMVIEVTSNEIEHGGIAAMYPITLRLARHDAKWLIMQFERGPYSPDLGEVMVRGTYECLPHRDTSGPQTDECALGLQKDDSSTHYALDMGLVRSTVPGAIAAGTHMSVSGQLVPIETLSSDWWTKYDVEGIIRVTNILEPVTQ
ncbi:MAG: hypothetical protein WC050_04765 [Candidatus Paceibacterota bacterium]